MRGKAKGEGAPSARSMGSKKLKGFFQAQEVGARGRHKRGRISRALVARLAQRLQPKQQEVRGRAEWASLAEGCAAKEQATTPGICCKAIGSRRSGRDGQPSSLSSKKPLSELPGAAALHWPRVDAIKSAVSAHRAHRGPPPVVSASSHQVAGVGS